MSFHDHHWGRADVWLVPGGWFDGSFTHNCDCDWNWRNVWDQRVGSVLAARRWVIVRVGEWRVGDPGYAVALSVFFCLW